MVYSVLWLYLPPTTPILLPLLFPHFFSASLPTALMDFFCFCLWLLFGLFWCVFCKWCVFMSAMVTCMLVSAMTMCALMSAMAMCVL